MALDELGIDVVLRAELDRFEQNMQRAGRVVEASTGSMDRATKRAENEFRRLESALDPAARAALRLERDTLKVQRALDKGVISTQRAAQVQAQLNNQYEASIARLGNVGTAVNQFSAQQARAAGTSRNMGFAVQNAGYQVGDFAVQVASGGGVLRPFIQQGTQMISMFGPWGAVLGAAGAVAGALAVSLWDTSDATKEAEEAAEEAAKKMEDFEESLADARKELRGMATDAEQAKIRILEMQAANAAPAFAGGSGALNRATTADAAIEQQRRLIESQNRGLQANLELWAQYLRLAGKIPPEERKIAEARGEVVDEINKEIEANQRLAAALGVSEKEYEIVKEQLNVLADEGYKGTAEQARELAARLVGSRGLRDAAKDSTKEIRKAQEQHEKVVGSIEDELATNKELIEALRISEREYEITAKTLDILEDGYKGTREEARKWAEQLVDSKETLSGIQREYDALEKAAQEAARQQQRIWDNAFENIQDSIADAIFEGEDLFESLGDTAKRIASEVASAWIIKPIIQGITGQGGFSVPGFGGGQIGGVGPSMGGFNLGSIGNMFSAPGGFGGIGDFFGGLFGGGSGGFTQLASGRVARSGLASAATGAGGLGGGLSGAMAAIPVWGWIAGAATLAKSFVEGSPRNSPEGALSTLLGPSLEEWQNDFGRSWATTVDPVGVVLGDLGLPSWMTAGGLLADVFGKKPSEGETFEARFEPSGAIRNVGVDNGASMATARQMADQFSAVMEAALGLTGGQFSQSWRVSRSARSGLRLDTGGGWQQFANEPDLIQQLLGASGGDRQLRNALRRSSASDLQGFATDIQALQAIQELVANDNMTELERAVKQVNDQFAQLIEKSRELGYGTADLVRIRNEEITSVREQFAEQERLAAQQERLAAQQDRIEALGAEAQVLQTLGQAGAQITSFMNAYQLSGQSSLNPTQRLSLAEQEFETLLSAVEGGNLGAIGALNQSASTFLGFARQQFASSSGFTDVETRVFEALRGVRSDILSEQNINDTIADTTAQLDMSQEERNEKLIATLREEIGALRQDINQLRISGEAA